jgi:N-acetylmuramidase/Peptidase_C39 like family
MPQITVKAGVGTTFLKTHPWQIAASAGKPEFKAFKCPEFNADKTRKTLAVNPTGLSQDIDGHAAITFDPPLTIGGNKYSKLFVAMCHWEGLDVLIKNKVAAATPFSAAGSGKLLLPVTYRSQVDNSDATGQGPGWRQCNSTSCCMLLEAWKGKDWLLKQSAGHAQPEDWYTTKLTSIGGDTTDSMAHVKLLTGLGLDCEFRTDMGLADAKETLDRGMGMTLGLRYRSGGHICYLVGKDLVKGGLYVHDPYGIRDLTDTQALDTWEQIGGDGGAARYFNIAVIKDCWIDQGDKAGWAIWPKPGVVGFNYQKPSVTLSTAATPGAAAPVVGGVLKRDDAMKAVIPDGCSRVTPKQATPFKARPVNSSDLKPEEKDSFDMDEAIIGVVSSGPNGHTLVTLPGTEQIKGRNTWYLFTKHIDIETPGGIASTAAGATITEADIKAAADLIGVEPRAMKTVMMVEASGGGFLPSGKPKILFEALYFHEFTGGKYDQSHPNISTPRWDPDQYKGGEAEWGRMEEAMKLDRSFAIQSASYGLGQVMGSHSQEMPSLGYVGQVERWLTDNQRSEGDQLKIMAKFIADNPSMLAALRDKRWAAFAEKYNGEGYAQNQYDVKLAEAYADLG